jgi:hypothetical protein
VLPEEPTERGAEATRRGVVPASDRIVHRFEGVVSEDDRGRARGRPEVGGEPVELGCAEASGGPTCRRHRVEHDAVHARRGIEGVVCPVRRQVVPREAVADGRAAGVPVLGNPLLARHEPTARIRGHAMVVHFARYPTVMLLTLLILGYAVAVIVFLLAAG